MICFPNAKINLGLRVTEKRPDGYHNIETVFYPIFLHDVLEAVPSECFRLHLSGIPIDGNPDDNLVTRAWNMLCGAAEVSPMEVHLHKSIPFGAGLGGGSADAAFLLKLVNQAQQLEMSDEALEKISARLGADCSFFIRNTPVYAYGKGECFEPIGLSLAGYYLLIVKPDTHVSTAEAYKGVMQATENCRRENPHAPWVHASAGKTSRFHSTTLLPDLLEQRPVSEWKDVVVNDFENTVFPLHPEIAAIKQRLYGLGALYASMTGSGSSVFGIFRADPHAAEAFPGCFVAGEEMKF